MPKEIVDISEIKVWRKCPRQWALSSRNKLHLRPKAVPKALNFGSVMHSCLHAMYNNQPIELDALALKFSDPEDFRILDNIVRNYVELVLPADLKKFRVLETEMKFEAPIHGSVDMVVEEIATGKIFGMEHKSGKTFRSDIFNLLDEQPQIYTIAIRNKYGRCDGIYLNEIKKLKTKLDQKRSKLTYTDEELDQFLQDVLRDKAAIMQAREHQQYFTACPDTVKCQMCDYQPLCLEIRVRGDITQVTPEIIDRYDYYVPERDHLEDDKEVSLTL